MQRREPEPMSSAVSDSLQIVNTRLLDTNSSRKVKVPTTLRWDLRLFSGLTHLRLGDSDRDDDCMPRTQTSQREFLDALRRMPALQCLDLQEPILPEAVDCSSLEPVYLQNLQDLRVFGTVSTLGFFLCQVNFPTAARTTIHCKHPDPELQLAAISPVFILLKRLLSKRPRALKLHRINVIRLHHFGLRCQGWISSESPSSLGGNFPFFNPDFTLVIKWNLLVSFDIPLPPNIDELKLGLLEIFPPDDVVSLSILSIYENDDTLFRLFPQIGQLPALNALSLKYISSTPFLQELDCCVPGELSMATYPALQYLDFTGHQIILTTLSNCLKKRSELGLGPKQLKVDLRGLELVDEKATALLEKVVEVEWVTDDLDSDDSGSEANSDPYHSLNSRVLILRICVRRVRTMRTLRLSCQAYKY